MADTNFHNPGGNIAGRPSERMRKDWRSVSVGRASCSVGFAMTASYSSLSWSRLASYVWYVGLVSLIGNLSASCGSRVIPLLRWPMLLMRPY